MRSVAPISWRSPEVSVAKACAEAGGFGGGEAPSPTRTNADALKTPQSSPHTYTARSRPAEWREALRA